MSLIRVLRSAAAVLTRTLYQDETATDAAGDVTVTVTRPDGTVLASATATKPPATVGIYTYTLPGGPAAPASLTWQLDHLTVMWTATLGGAAVSMTDRVEVVGAYLFGLPEARAADASLADTVRYTALKLADKRVEVEQECDRICGWSWVPRFGRATLSGTGGSTLLLPHRPVRTVRSVAIRATPGGAFTALDATALASVAATAGGVLTRGDGGLFTAGVANVIVEYEHGHDQPTEDLKEAAMYRLRSRLNLTRSGVPDRVNSYSTPDGASYRVTLPARGSTGIPDVDAVYQDHEAPPLGFA